VVFVGDLLRGSVVGSGAETHLYMCDLEANKRDIANLLTVEAPAATLVFPGHFGPVTRESVMDHFDVKAPAR
jgi:glyoxylase-like metal-dependent hydrolase (beta-lactamase superfamily II)